MLEPHPSCAFCSLDLGQVWLENEHALSFRDRYPVTEGHTLVIPRAHHASVFDADPQELLAVWNLVGQVREALRDELGVQAFTVGVNDGADAGQTVAHGHVHVIPRRPGDVPDPRGGVRWVVPARAAYWEWPER